MVHKTHLDTKDVENAEYMPKKIYPITLFVSANSKIMSCGFGNFKLK